MNGMAVGQDEALGHWATWQERVLYQSADVTRMILAEGNAAGLVNGLVTAGTIQLGRIPCNSTRRGASPSLALRLILRLRFTPSTSIVEQHDWRSSKSLFLSDDVYFGVDFDARALIDGFSMPPFVANDWGTRE